jgi:protoporphyrinogen oxidase
MKKIAIIGAGPAGLTSAFLLQSFGYEVHLYEVSKKIGGMCKSIKLWNGIVDLGPHRFFSSDPRVNNFWIKNIQKNYCMIKRQTRIFYNNKFFDYPINPINALLNLGFFESLICIKDFIKIKLFPKKKTYLSFEDWVKSRFGKRLYEIFFKKYSEKLWGISCSKLSSDFASQRIKKLSLYEVIKNFFIITKKHATLVDEFAFPLKGTGLFYDTLYKKFLKKGGKCFFQAKIKKINFKEKKIFINNSLKYDHLISTMPLTNLVKILTSDSIVLKKANNLKFRNTLLVYVKFRENNIFSDQWLYINSPEIKTGRITNFNNWTKSIKPTSGSILCFEYWYNDNEDWKNLNKKKIISNVISDINKISLFKNCKPMAFKLIGIPKCYPIYEIGYKKNLNYIKKFLNKYKNIIPIGRYGSFKYNNQDHSILMGILASEKIIHNKKINLWEINTDYEYQEKNYITETGLKTFR